MTKMAVGVHKNFLFKVVKEELAKGERDLKEEV